MKKILWTGVLAGVLMMVVNVILNFVFDVMFPGFRTIYENTAVFRSMDDPLMMLFWAYPLVLGIGLAWVWSKVAKMFKKDSVWSAGLKFGWAYFVVAALPAFFINVTSYNLPVMMIVTWTVMSLFNGFIAGWIFARWAR